MTNNPYEPPKAPDDQQEADRKRKEKQTLVWIMVAGSIPALTAPLWAPSGITNLVTICGLISAAILYSICIYRWKQL